MQRFNGDVPTTNTVFAAGGHHTTPTKPHLHILHSIFQSPLTYILLSIFQSPLTYIT